MVAANFERSMPHIRAYEGKFQNHKADAGGRTYEGVTQRVWDAYCENAGLPKRTLTSSTGSWKDWAKHRDAIYRQQYWAAAGCDQLPAGVDFVVFDGAVNSGVSRSVRWLQAALGVKADGVIGELTRRALRAVTDHDALVDRILERREAFLRVARNRVTKQLLWPVFGKGWLARLAAVKATGQAWATGSVGPKPTPIREPVGRVGDAEAPTVPTTAGPDTVIGAGGSLTGAGTVIETARQHLEPYAAVSDVVQYIVIGLVIAGVAITVGGFVWRHYQQRKAAAVKEAIA